MIGFTSTLITISLTHSWSGALLEKLPIVQPLKKLSAFMEPEGSLPCLQETYTGTYFEPEKSNPYHPILFL
jgi:hypothetical protein